MKFLYALAFTLIPLSAIVPAPALALQFPTLDPYMVDAEVRKVNNFISVDGDTVKVNVMGKGYAPNQPYFNKTVSIPKSRFLSWLKANLKNLMKLNPWWVAFAAAMAAAGWAFDELLNQMTVNTNKYYGSCGQFTNVTPLQCAKNMAAASGSTYQSLEYVSGPNPPVVGQTTKYRYYYYNPQWGNTYGQFNFQLVNIKVEKEPVTDTALLDSVFSNFMADPVAAAQAMTAPGNYPYDDLFKDVDLKYIPGVSEADYPALDCYFRGALQTSNAAAACYATEAEYQRIKQIAEQIKQNNTPGGVVDGMNESLKDPLTQAQLEETLKKQDEKAKQEADEISKIDTKPITDAYTDSKLKEEYDKLKERVTDPSKMPQLPPLPAAEQIDLPTYKGCQTISMNMFNATLTFPNPDQCKKLEQVKTGLGYLMYVLTALGIIMELFRRVE